MDSLYINRELSLLEFHKRVRAGYLELAKDARWVTIDARPVWDEVHENLKAVLLENLS